jgi:hypothetical protein
MGLQPDKLRAVSPDYQIGKVALPADRLAFYRNTFLDSLD